MAENPYGAGQLCESAWGEKAWCRGRNRPCVSGGITSKSTRNSIPAHPRDVYPYSLQWLEAANRRPARIKRHSRICDRFRSHLRLSSRACEDVCPWHSCYAHILPCLLTLGDLVTRVGERKCNELVTLGSESTTEYIALPYAKPRSHTSCIPSLPRFI